MSDNRQTQVSGHELNTAAHEALNSSISKWLKNLGDYIKVKFITPTKYKFE